HLGDDVGGQQERLRQWRSHWNAQQVRVVNPRLRYVGVRLIGAETEGVVAQQHAQDSRAEAAVVDVLRWQSLVEHGLDRAVGDQAAGGGEAARIQRPSGIGSRYGIGDELRVATGGRRVRMVAADVERVL